MRRPTLLPFIVLLAIVAVGSIWSSGDAAPPVQDRQRPGARPQPSAQQQRMNAANNANNRRSVRTARAQTPGATQPPKKMDAKTRAEFQKLIGANWVWSPAYKKDEVPVGECYFRKTITTAGDVDFAQVHIACDNRYELFVNGQAVGTGSDWRKMDVHDVMKLMRPGVNVVAIKASNLDAGAAGLVARVILKQKGGTYENFSTDDSWRTSVKEAPNWKAPDFRDREWLGAKVYGSLGAVLPWGDEVVISSEGSRFMIDPEFVVERMVTDEQAGSLIAMAFDARGDILASQEGGPLLLIQDKNQDGSYETVVTFCDKLKNVQGIMSLGTQVFAVGEGPDGGGLYKLSGLDALGRATEVTPLLKFRGLIGEHGPHAVQLGPEGYVYVLCGNFARVDAEPKASSPYNSSYEGDLVQPRYEDPQGYGAGVPAPGGTILRTDTNGSFVEIVAGGLRNPYDIAFNGEGEMFTYDADMEWDIGTPWYRPTRLNHVPLGAELGWRSGWAKWPDYYLDSLPAVIDVGPGSPTGIECYDHVAFPKRFQNTLFVGDWALGHIHAIHLDRDGASYTARKTTILKGRPLNVTDLAVGPDGALYFSTGGRGTDGGVYRIRWTGTVPPESLRLGTGIQEALRQPQFQSDWARQRIARVKKDMGTRWEPELLRIVNDVRSRQSDRLRAIDLMTFFGPAPTVKSLNQLARDRNPAMRAKIARLMGTQDDPQFTKPLTKMLRDPDPMVRRIACESIEHRNSETPVDALVQLLGDSDRFVAYAARRTLERIPADSWREQVLTAEKARMFLQGAAGLLLVEPTVENCDRILVRCDAMLRERAASGAEAPTPEAEAEFRDTLRIVQLVLIRGQIAAADVPKLSQSVVAVYPTADALANRELVRLLVYLQPPEAAKLLAGQLQSNIGEVEKLQIASHAARLTTGWQTQEKLVMLRFFETVRGIEGGHSVKGYLENFARDFFTNLTLAERKQVLAAGEKFPTSALSILAKLPPDSGPEVWAELRALDQRIEGLEGEHFARLRVGITAVLGGSKDPESHAYLREVYASSPERRAPIAMSLTQNPQGENWDVLIDSLRSIDGIAAPEVLAALRRVNRRPQSAEPYRFVILTGLKMPATAGDLSVRLLEFWTGQRRTADAKDAAVQLASWQAWYAEQFPDASPAELPQESQNNKWSYDELISFLESPDGKAGRASRGTQIFTSAQCINCHRFNGTGQNIGPDLTAVSQRFQRREVLESIVYPSHVVSDQYASHSVTANGRTYVGIIAREPDGSLTVLQSDGGKLRLAADEIEDVEPSKLSTMPDGLLNTLTLEQVADLFALLMEGGNTNPNVAGRPGSQR